MASRELIRMVSFLFRLAQILLLARVVISWLGMERNSLTQFIYNVTEPVMRPLRENLPLRAGMLDLTPFVLFFILRLLENLVVSLLLRA